MKKYIFIVAIAAFSSVAKAQTGRVGIDTGFPKAKFHIDGAKDNPQNATDTPSSDQVKNDVAVNTAGNVLIGTLTEGTVANSASSTAEQKLARLTIAGGDAMINSITTGRGGGQVESNIAFGTNALLENTTGANNTAIGNNTLKVNTTGTNNTAVGSSALTVNTNGVNNTAIGNNALKVNTTGTNNTAVGASALTVNTTGVNNVAVGTSAMINNTTGTNNTAMGINALAANTTQSNNTAVGTSALAANSTGFSNVAIGVSALSKNTAGSNNVALGTGASSELTSGDNNIVIGASQNVPAVAESNQLNIGGAIFGKGLTSTNPAAPTGYVGVGTSTPARALSVAAVNGENSPMNINTSGMVILFETTMDVTLPMLKTGDIYLIKDIFSNYQNPPHYFLAVKL